MTDRETYKALDEAQWSISELNRALDAAADRARMLGAEDILERISAARAATVRGGKCFSELRKTLVGPKGDLH